jgi:RimJ/RimL family protein N-acetyltransferase
LDWKGFSEQGCNDQSACFFTNWCFQNTDLIRIEAKVFAMNPASRQVLRKAGFIEEGLQKSQINKANRLDLLIFCVEDKQRNNQISLHQKKSNRIFAIHDNAAI